MRRDILRQSERLQESTIRSPPGGLRIVDSSCLIRLWLLARERVEHLTPSDRLSCAHRTNADRDRR